MNDKTDEIDVTLGALLGRELDPQCGRARTRFRAEMWQAEQAHRLGRRGWMMTAAGSALAACVGLVISFTTMRQLSQQPAGVLSPASPGRLIDPANAVAASSGLSAPSSLERNVYWRTVDDGTIQRDDESAVHQLRQQLFEKVRWYDPRHDATIELTRPREQTIQVEVPRQ